MADEYISREAFKAEALRLSTHYLNEWDTLGVLAAADRIPSADVAPVRHGRWVKKHDNICYWHECSECGIKPPKDQWKNEWKSAYCPNCGAKMDGGET